MLTATLRAADRAVQRLQTILLGAGILGIAANSIANVLARNLGGGGFAFAEEVNQALVLWVTFLGIGVGARRARHIRMAAFYDQLRGRARKLAWMAISGGTALLLLALTVLAARYVATTYAIGGVTPALRLPLWAVYAVVPAGLLLGCVEYGLTLVRNLREPGIHASHDLVEGDEDRGVAT